MLLDLLTFVLVLRARDQIAARQLLKELTYRLDDEYAANVLLKGVGFVGGSSREWVAGVY